ncbi:MAG: hypothetical protein AAF696_33935 [Bacteroidota bacterium]
MKNKEEDIELEEFKYLIDSRNLSKEEKEIEREAILKAREERFRRRSRAEMLASRLLQLRYKMEEYLEDSGCELGTNFSDFLSTYVDILYKKRKDFAEDLSIPPISLSHIINKHREPTENFLQRLIIHSQETYRGICNFEKELWIKVYYQDKICSLTKSSIEWTQKESKYVKGKPINI